MFKVTVFQDNPTILISDRDKGRQSLFFSADRSWLEWPPPAAEVLYLVWNRLEENEKEFLDLTGEFLRISVIVSGQRSFDILEQTGTIRQLATRGEKEKRILSAYYFYGSSMRDHRDDGWNIFGQNSQCLASKVKAGTVTMPETDIPLILNLASAQVNGDTNRRFLQNLVEKLLDPKVWVVWE